MKDNELYDVVKSIANDADKNQATINELQEVVAQLEEEQQALKAEQEKFLTGLDERIAAAVNLGLDKGLEESKHSISEHINWCQRVNNNLIDQRKELSEGAAEIDSKVAKAVTRIEIAAIILLFCMAAMYAALWVSMDAVQNSLNAANQIIQQAADYINQVNANLNLALHPPTEVKPDLVPESVKTLSAVAGLVLFGVPVGWLVLKFLGWIKK